MITESNETTEQKKCSKKQEELPKLKIDVNIESKTNDFNYYISEPSESESDNEPSKKRIKKTDIPKCPGCYPIFQLNQLGHIGPNGCLGDEL